MTIESSFVTDLSHFIHALMRALGVACIGAAWRLADVVCHWLDIDPDPAWP